MEKQSSAKMPPYKEDNRHPCMLLAAGVAAAAASCRIVFIIWRHNCCAEVFAQADEAAIGRVSQKAEKSNGI
jgi:hypothetical protein